MSSLGNSIVSEKANLGKFTRKGKLLQNEIWGPEDLFWKNGPAALSLHAKNSVQDFLVRCKYLLQRKQFLKSIRVLGFLEHIAKVIFVNRVKIIFFNFYLLP